MDEIYDKSPVVETDGDYRRIRFRTKKELSINLKSKTAFKSKNRPQTLFFTEASFFKVEANTALGGEELTFIEGEEIEIIAKLQSGAFYAVTVTTKNVYDCFFIYDSLKEKSEAQKKLFSMSKGKQNNILLQLGLINWSEDLPISQLFDPDEVRFKLELCGHLMPQNVVDVIEDDLSHSRFHPKTALQLGNIHYCRKISEPIPYSYTTHLLKKHTFMDEAEIKRVAKWMAEPRTHEPRLLLEGPRGASQEEFVDAMAKLLHMPVQTCVMVGKSSGFELVGSSQTYKVPEDSVPVELWQKAKSNRAVLFYQDAGELGESTENGSAKLALKAIINKNEFYDLKIRCAFPMEYSLICATTEKDEDINPAAREMFDLVLHFGLSDEQKVKAIKEHFLADMTEAKNISFTDAALDTAASYTDDYGINKIKEFVRYLVQKADNGSVIDSPFVANNLADIADFSTPYMRYKLHKQEYSHDIAEAIEETQKQLMAKNADKKPDYMYLRERLEILSELRLKKPDIEFDRAAFYKNVNSTHFGLDRVKNELADFLTAKSILRTNEPLRLYFEGLPGSGKTSISSAVAKALGADLCRIDLSSATIAELLGISREHLGGGRPSVITSALVKAKNALVVQLEELEKADPQVLNAILKITDDDHVYHDKYLNVDICAGRVHFIATANGFTRICNIDRFRVFIFEAYTSQHKLGIFDKLVAKLENESGNVLNIEVDDDAKKFILDRYLFSASVREMEKALRRITEHLLSDGYYRNSDEIFIRIDRTAVERALDNPHHIGNFESIPERAGVARGLAVTAAGSSMTFGIEAVVLDAKSSEIETTGLLADETLEQVKLARTYINMKYRNALDNKSIHVHFNEGSVPKAGSSAGAATFLALFSAVMNIPVDRKIAVTGELTLLGGVSRIGEIELKLDAAMREGCNTVIMPKENLQRMSDGDREYYSRKMKLVGICSIDELLEEVWPGVINVKVC